MLNLLFIVKNPKVGVIKSHLQPQLKARIDLVADFDHGLKDVFEKRPTVVVIQEQIAGVSADSVARHIQMLLGSGAPTFVLAHEGNTKAKTVKGLFEYLVDLARNENELLDDIISVLRSILGDKADSLIIPARAEKSDKPIKDGAGKKSDVSADELVDDFLSELEKIENSGVVFEGQAPASPAVTSDEHAMPLASNTDEMASMLVDAVRQAKLQDAAPEMVQEQANTESVRSEGAAPPAAEPASLTASPAARLQTAAAKPAAVAPSPRAVVEPEAVVKPVKVHDAVPEDLLQAFEKNYNSCATSWKKKVGIAVAVVVVTALGGGGWYLRTYRPELLSFGGGSKPQVAVKPSAAPVKPDAAKTAAAPPATGIPADKAAGKGTVEEKVPAAAPVVAAMPSFIKSGRLDAAFSAKKPGWERYLDKAHDIRVFKAENRIKAVQVIAAKGGTVNSDFLKSVLGEVVGSSDYSLGKREKKEGYRGYLIQRGTVNSRADLVLYRSGKSDAIAAFVVSVN